MAATQPSLQALSPTKSKAEPDVAIAAASGDLNSPQSKTKPRSALKRPPAGVESEAELLEHLSDARAKALDDVERWRQDEFQLSAQDWGASLFGEQIFEDQSTQDFPKPLEVPDEVADQQVARTIGPATSECLVDPGLAIAQGYSSPVPPSSATSVVLHSDPEASSTVSRIYSGVGGSGPSTGLCTPRSQQGMSLTPRSITAHSKSPRIEHWGQEHRDLTHSIIGSIDSLFPMPQGGIVEGPVGDDTLGPPHKTYPHLGALQHQKAQNANEQRNQDDLLVVSMSVLNVDYNQLIEIETLRSSFESSVKEEVALAAGDGVTAADVVLTLSAGSVIVEATIMPPESVNVHSLLAKFESAESASQFGEVLALRVCQVHGIKAICKGVVSITVTAAVIQAATETKQDAETRVDIKEAGSQIDHFVRRDARVSTLPLPAAVSSARIPWLNLGFHMPKLSPRASPDADFLDVVPEVGPSASAAAHESLSDVLHASEWAAQVGKPLFLGGLQNPGLDVQEGSLREPQGLRMSLREIDAVRQTWEMDRVAGTWMRFDAISGFFVIANAVLLGIQTTDRITMNSGSTGVLFDADMWKLVERIFCAIFSSELSLRLLYLKSYAFRDAWIYLDFFLVGISVIDAFGLTDVILGGGGSYLTILRAFRLIRLLRIIRLIRLLRELWLLVQCLWMSMFTLAWVVFLLFIGMYIFAVLMTDMVGKEAVETLRSVSSIVGNDSKNASQSASMVSTYVSRGRTLDGLTQLHLTDEWIAPRWGGIMKSMFTLCRLVVFDSWASELKPFANDRILVFFGLLIFIITGAMGVLNLLMGTLCRKSMAVTAREAKALLQQKQVYNYGILLKVRREILARNMMTRDTAFTRREIIAMMEDLHLPTGSLPIAPLLAEAELHISEVTMVLDAMELVGRRRMDLSQLIETLTWMQGVIEDRAIDVYCMERKLHFCQVHISAAKDLVSSAKGFPCFIDRLQPFARLVKNRQAAALTKKKHDKADTSAEEWLEMKVYIPAAGNLPGSLQTISADSGSEATITTRGGGVTRMVEDHRLLGMTKCEAEKLKMEEDKSHLEQMMMRFDCLAAILVFLNAVLLGMQLDHPESDSGVDYFAIESAFLVWFALEIFLRTLLFIQLQTGIYKLSCGLCPLDPVGRWGTTCKVFKQLLPEMLRDPSFIIDILVIFVAVVDSALTKASLAVPGLSMVRILKVFRLVRSVRVFRLIRCFKELWLMVLTCAQALLTAIWAVALLAVLTYVFAILCTEGLAEDPAKRDLYAKDWGGILSSMWTLARLATLDGFGGILGVLHTNGDSMEFVLGFVFTIIAAFGIMQMVVGIMADICITNSYEQRQKDIRRGILTLVRTFHSLPSMKRLMDGDHLKREQLREVLMEDAVKAVFRKTMNLSPAGVWTIYDKLDPVGRGEIEVSTFIEVLLRLQRPLGNPDIVLCSQSSGTLRDDISEIKDRMVNLTADFAVTGHVVDNCWKMFQRKGVPSMHYREGPEYTKTAHAYNSSKVGMKRWRRVVTDEIDWLMKSCSGPDQNLSNQGVSSSNLPLVTI